MSREYREENFILHKDILTLSGMGIPTFHIGIKKPEAYNHSAWAAHSQPAFCFDNPVWRLRSCTIPIVSLGGYLAIATFAGLIWLSLGPAGLDHHPQVALAASDPVIAAAGDIACDPASSHFNAGNGTATTCRQKYTSDLFVNAGLKAVLPLGDDQYL